MAQEQIRCLLGLKGGRDSAKPAEREAETKNVGEHVQADGSSGLRRLASSSDKHKLVIVGSWCLAYRQGTAFL